MVMKSLSSFICAIIAGVLLIGCAAAGTLESAASQKIIAIGDLHGDYDAYESLLRESGLTDQRGRWSGGDAIFVQTGDVPDRGPDSLKIIRHLQKLQRQAERAGGQIVTLVGNHEAMNVTGDLRYVSAGEYTAFVDRNSEKLRDGVYEANHDLIEAAYRQQDETLSNAEIKAKWIAETPLGAIEHHRAWRPDGDIGAWVAQHPAVAIIGDSLFVHGGISEKYVHFSIDEINAMTDEALHEGSVDPGSIINDEYGPLWYRGLVRREDAAGDETAADHDASNTPERLSIEEEIDLALNTYGVAHIVVGHTPSLKGITAHYGGKLIQIDTGISSYYGGTHSFLSIEDGGVYAHDNGVVTPIGEQQ